MHDEAWAARRRARTLVDSLEAVRHRVAQAGGIDLGPALEHGLFTAIRDRRVVDAGGGRSLVRSWTRIAAASVAARPAARHDAWPHGAALLLPGSWVHLALWEPVATEIRRRGHAVAAAWPGREPGQSGMSAPLPVSAAHLDPAWLPRLVRHARRVAGERRWLERAWREIDPDGAVLSRQAVASLPRYALSAAQLDSLVHHLRPGVLVCYNEVGPLSRLAPAVAHANGLSAVDLPHAEAADPTAIAGIEYDAVGVFGDRAVEVMAKAGVPAERVVAIGAPHVEELLRAARREPQGGERRIVFTSQFIGGSMSPVLKERTLRAALAVAAVAAPAQLVIRPHPLERDDVATRVLRHGPIPPGVHVVVEPGRPLAEHLPGAWALVTAWSNTAYEAAAVGVPVIAVNASGGPAVLPLAEEGLALGAVDEETAAAAARRLLDPEARREVIDAAARRVRTHLGPLDGRSAERAADLVLAHVRTPAAPRLM